MIFFPPLCPGRYKFSISAGQGSLLRLPRCHEQLYAAQKCRMPPSDGVVRIPGTNPSFWQEQNKPAGLFWSSQDQRVIRSPPQVSWRGWELLLGQVAGGSARRGALGSQRTSCSPAGAAERRKDEGRKPWDARGGRAGTTPRCFKGSSSGCGGGVMQSSLPG